MSSLPGFNPNPDAATLEDLTCSICLEVLQEPVTLPCFHSMCYECWTTLIGENQATYKCPECRQVVMQPNKVGINQALWQVIQNKYSNELARRGLTDDALVGPSRNLLRGVSDIRLNSPGSAMSSPASAPAVGPSHSALRAPEAPVRQPQPAQPGPSSALNSTATNGYSYPFRTYNEVSLPDEEDLETDEADFDDEGDEARFEGADGYNDDEGGHYEGDYESEGGHFEDDYVSVGSQYNTYLDEGDYLVEDESPYDGSDLGGEEEEEGDFEEEEEGDFEEEEEDDFEEEEEGDFGEEEEDLGEEEEDFGEGEDNFGVEVVDFGEDEDFEEADYFEGADAYYGVYDYEDNDDLYDTF